MSRFAIIGMACVLPDATSPDEFYRNLLDGVDSRRDGGAEEFGIDPSAPGGWGDRQHAITSRRGGFVHETGFDAEGFRLPAEYLAGLDRSFRWPLQVAREALRDCGLDVDRLDRARTGLVLGNYSFPTVSSGKLAIPAWREAVSQGLHRAGVLQDVPAQVPEVEARPENIWAFGLPPRVVAEALGLRGPQFALDAACSSAVYSLKLATDYLQSGQADLMLAGAVCASDSTLIHLSFSDLGAYPEDGRSQPFDRRSSGIVTGQGAGMFAVKRLADAVAAGDRIYAVVEGIGLSNDGGGRHLLSPNVQGQHRAYQQAYSASAVSPSEIDYLECHATGTPLGDRIELEGVLGFFGERGGVPALGSVKANIGHLLSVAGFSSLLKVILAMNEGMIPATQGVAEPLPELPSSVLVTENRPWPQRGRARYAAVSAFGFGGTNAHLVLSDSAELRESDTSQGPDEFTAPKADIIGVGCVLGSIRNRVDFEKHVFDAKSALRPLPERRWYGLDVAAGVDGSAAPAGAYCADVEIDPLSHRISPAEFENFNAQHALMMTAADEALADAGYRRAAPGGESSRVAVVVAMDIEPHVHGHQARFDVGRYLRDELRRTGTQLDDETLGRLEEAVRDGVHAELRSNESLSYIGNIVASRISSRYDFVGPSFTVSSDGAGGSAALEVASLLLRDENIEAVLVGGVDLPGGLVARMGRIEEDAGDRPVGEGAAALVLTRASERSEGRGSYATIEGIASAYPEDAGELGRSVDRRTVGNAARAALDGAGRTTDDVGYVEISGAGEAEVAGLSDVYGDRSRPCVLGSLVELVGDTQNIAPLLGVLKLALSIHLGTFAPSTDRTATETGISEGAPFWLSHGPAPWLRENKDCRRIGAVSVVGKRGTHAHVLLAGSELAAAPRLSGSDLRWTEAGGELVLPVGADDPAALVREVRRVREEMEDESAVAVVRRALNSAAECVLTAVFVGADAAALTRELDAAIRDLPSALEQRLEWATPAGSYCTARPIGASGKVAFVYPGAFSAYPGAGADLFRLSPRLLDVYESIVDDPRRQFMTDELHPQQLNPLSRRELMIREATLAEDLPAMLASGTNFAVLHTWLLKDLLGVPMQGSFGYSLGESSMLYAVGVWPIEEASDKRLRETSLFRDVLCGPKTAVRRAWDLPDDTDDSRVWESYLVLGDADVVREYVSNHDRLFLTHINSPKETVVAGDPSACAELAETLGLQTARTPTQHVVHCPLLDPFRAELADINRYPSTPGEVELLSAYDYDVVRDFSSDVIAERVAATLCSTVDFDRLVRAAYARGYRYFIDVGPSATCTRWIDQILDDQPHLAIALDRRGAPTTAGVAHTLARLISHGVEVDRTALVPRADTEPGGGRYAVECGGDSIVDRVADRASEVVVPARAGVVPAVAMDTVVDASAGTASVGTASVGTASAATLDELTFDGVPFVFVPQADPEPVVAPGHHAPTSLAGRVAMPAEALTDRPATTRPSRRVVAADLRSSIIDGFHGSIRASSEAFLRTHLAFQHLQMDWFDEQLSRRLGGAPSPTATGEAAVLPSPPPAARTSPGPAEAPPRPAERASSAELASPGFVAHRADRDPRVILDQQDLLEFARGKVGNVFGESFAVVDEFPSRVRLPEPPYFFVSRVTALDAETGRFEPSFIRTEYDVPDDAWYGVDGGVPPAVTIEAGQCDMLLISYLGIDFHNKGERFYRLLDSTIVFHDDLPHAGQTLRYDVSIDRFAWNGDTLVFFFSYRCYADGKLLAELERACAGFFTQYELDNAVGALPDPTRDRPVPRKADVPFKPLAHSDRTSLGPDDLELLAAGDRASVFGPEHGQEGYNPSLRLPDRMRMVDELLEIDPRGGPAGLGRLVGRKQLTPDGWYFNCHFTDDPVMAGSMVAEGAVQMMQIYALHLGMHLCLPDARFQSVPGLRTEVKVRGQVVPGTPEIRYVIDITDLTLIPRPTVVGDLTLYDGDKAIVSMRNFGVRIKEKEATPYRLGPGGTAAHDARVSSEGEPVLLNEMHLAHSGTGDLGVALGPEFDVYHDHRAPMIPNGAFQLVDRVVRINGDRGTLAAGASQISEYDSPEDAWYYGDNGVPEMPYGILMESALQSAILLGYFLGATLDEPEKSFSIRNLDGHAKLLRRVDLRGKTIRQNIKMLSSQKALGSTLQSFAFELCADGEAFYVGESLYGYYTADALAQQIGLDGGAYVPPWIEAEGAGHPARTVVLDERPELFTPGGLCLANGRLRLLDSAEVVPGGGNHGLGYIRARRRMDPEDWYFACHFHEDPVMPGSLGIESMMQALKLFVLETGLAEDVPDARFTIPPEVEMSWKYRGQILRHDEEMTLDIHVSDVRREGDRVMVVAEANLWKPGMRIYAVKNLAVEVSPQEERA